MTEHCSEFAGLSLISWGVVLIYLAVTRILGLIVALVLVARLAAEKEKSAEDKEILHDRLADTRERLADAKGRLMRIKEQIGGVLQQQ